MRAETKTSLHGGTTLVFPTNSTVFSASCKCNPAAWWPSRSYIAYPSRAEEEQGSSCDCGLHRETSLHGQYWELAGTQVNYLRSRLRGLLLIIRPGLRLLTSIRKRHHRDGSQSPGLVAVRLQHYTIY